MHLIQVVIWYGIYCLEHVKAIEMFVVQTSWRRFKTNVIPLKGIFKFAVYFCSFLRLCQILIIQ